VFICTYFNVSTFGKFLSHILDCFQLLQKNHIIFLFDVIINKKGKRYSLQKDLLKKTTCIITFIIHNIPLCTLTLSVIVTPAFHTWYLQSIFRMLKERKKKKPYKLGHFFNGFRMSAHLGEVNYYDSLECQWIDV
jgi:hypothetical protein